MPVARLLMGRNGQAIHYKNQELIEPEGDE